MTLHSYDIEGIVRIQSVVPLRELAYFRVESVDAPDLVVLGGFPSVAPHLRTTTRRVNGGIAHREQLGAFGADFDVDFGKPVVVRANPLLRWSPHVLYTNVVEPLLRFIFASKGYALLHCASVVQGDEVLLLSAQTDTGKTTTVLRLIARHDVAFLADDMTIIEPGGIARRYPKPMTMSFHTFKAFDWRLTPVQRGKLAVQSRVHSKSGRRVGHGIARLPVPIMAINAVTQGIIPPPKHHVSDLMKVTIAERAPIRRVVFMERGEPMEAAVEVPAAVDLLLRNTEDAYTFPPYRSMAPFITIDGVDHEELLARERAVLHDALQGADIRLLRVEDRSWADLIPAMASAPAPVP